MKNVARIIILFLAFHIIYSLGMLFVPQFQEFIFINKFYKYYLLPGPFFSDDRIDKSTILLLSSKVDGKWSPPVNPTLSNFVATYRQLNPTYVYRSSLERDIYEGYVLHQASSPADTVNSRHLNAMRTYFTSRYVPRQADSIRMMIVRFTARNFEYQVDTLHTMNFEMD